MRRSGGVTAFAIIFMVVGALTFVQSVVFMAVPALHAKTPPFFILAGVNILLGILWVLAGVGVLTLRRWARYMAIALAGVTVLFKLLVTVVGLLFKGLYNKIVGFDLILSKYMLGLILQPIWVLVLLVICVLAIWFFARRKVGAQFSGRAVEELAEVPAPEQAGIVIGPGVSEPAAYSTAPTATGEEVLTARAWLVLKGPRGQVRHFPVKGDVLRIGRGARNDVDLEDTAVSEEHAKIYMEGGKYILHDMGSLNGTRLNGHLILKHDLRDNDTIQVGNTTLVFKCA